MLYPNLRAFLVSSHTGASVTIENPNQVAMFGLNINPCVYLEALLVFPSWRKALRTAALQVATDRTGVWDLGYFARYDGELIGDVHCGDLLPGNVLNIPELLFESIALQWTSHELACSPGRLTYHFTSGTQFPAPYVPWGEDMYPLTVENAAVPPMKLVDSPFFADELEQVAQDGLAMGLRDPYIRHVVAPMMLFRDAVEAKEKRWRENARSAALSCRSLDLSLWMSEWIRLV